MFKKIVLYKDVVNYINGDMDLETSELMENNTKFMISVIKYTRDKKMYQFCSDRVKKDYDMVKFMVEKFSDDINFISNLADGYISNNKTNDDDYTYDELIILMSKVYKEKYPDDFNKYAIKANAFLSFKLFVIEELFKDPKIKNNYGLGFGIFEMDYSGSKIIMDFVAKSLIDEIFYGEERENLEKILHKNYKDYNKITEKGINTFLINYISTFDKSLAGYVSNNIELINSIKKHLERINKNWNKYNENLNNEKIEFFIEKISDFKDNCCFYKYSIDYIINYIVDYFHLENIFSSYLNTLKQIDEYRLYNYNDCYECSYEYELESIFNELTNESKKINPNEMNSSDLFFLQKIIKIAREIFIEDKYLNDDEYIDSEKETKILKFPVRTNINKSIRK